jgi:hypothetical protein
METAMLCHRRRTMQLTNPETRDMLQTLVERFGSKLHRSIQNSLAWSQSSTDGAPQKGFRLPSKGVRALARMTVEGAAKNIGTVGTVTSPRNGRTQPLITPLLYLWDVIPINEPAPPSPYQKRQFVKPSALRYDEPVPDEQRYTNWNKIRQANTSNFSLASQMSSMSVMSVCSRISNRSHISVSLAGLRSRRSAER